MNEKTGERVKLFAHGELKADRLHFATLCLRYHGMDGLRGLDAESHNFAQ